MAYIVLKKTGGTGNSVQDWQLIRIVEGASTAEEAIWQSYDTTGTFRACEWSEENEAVVELEPKLTPTRSVI